MLNPVRQRGFNLIEMAVTLLIVGFLAATAAPGMADWIRSTRLRSLAETTQNGLQKARNEAMKSNKVVTFWLVSPSTTSRPDASCKLSSESAAWVISLDNPEDKCHTDASATDEPRIVETYGPGQSGASVVIKATDKDANARSSISFNAYGQPVTGLLPISQIDIEHTEAGPRKLRIQISASGGIRLCDRDVAAPDPRACN